MHVGDRIKVEHDGQVGAGIVDAIAGDRVYVRLTVRPSQPWISPVTGGTVPAGCPISYLLWVSAAAAAI